MKLCTALVALAALVATSARADEYPSHSVTMIVPFAAGGPSDVSGRALADALGKQLHQSIIVENDGGAGGNIGATKAAHAKPDGYTMMFTNFSIALSPALYDNLDYDAVKDFSSVGVAIFSATMLLARNDLPPKTVPDLVTYLKTNGEKVLMATTGPGGPSDLCARLIMKATGAKVTLVNYKGTAPAMTDLIPGHVDLMCDSVATAAPQVKAGVVKTFGVTGHERSHFVPDVPTLVEQGLTSIDYSVWSALYVPSQTPKPILDRIAAAFQGALKDPDFQKINATTGQEQATGDLITPAGADAYLKSEIARWTPLLKGSNAGN
ncbi:MAG TPA: tripartite tricarboxylate transporter substrate binding protein [Stellaceae bacterium]|jgi:tripartite-type tricarboxylate transporter receptor subunit TctC|nr:tripartite tricarboxylate transporter substrate binding protein [Stellaceae bacterium]